MDQNDPEADCGGRHDSLKVSQQEVQAAGRRREMNTLYFVVSEVFDPSSTVGERGFMGRGSGGRQDWPARLSPNAPLASEPGPLGHVGSCRASFAMPRRGLHA